MCLVRACERWGAICLRAICLRVLMQRTLGELRCCDSVRQDISCPQLRVQVEVMMGYLLALIDGELTCIWLHAGSLAEFSVSLRIQPRNKRLRMSRITPKTRISSLSTRSNKWLIC